MARENFPSHYIFQTFLIFIIKFYMGRVIEKLVREEKPLISSVERDEFILASEQAFDCIFDGTSTFYPWKMPINIPKNFKIGVIVGSSGCLGLGTKVMMYDGTFKNVEDVIVGDLLMGPDSTPRKVLELFRGVDQMYIIKQNNGIDYRVNSTHILSLKDRKTKSIRITDNGVRKRINYIKADEENVNNISVLDYLKRSKNYQQTNKGYKSGLLNFNDYNITIDPYFLGLWLGDGDSSCLSITNIDSEVIENIKLLSEKLGMQISENINKNGVGKYLIHNGRVGKSSGNLLLNEFKKLNLINNKHIPLNYLVSSEETRLQILAGLIDTDGSYNNKKNVFEITQKNNILAENITQLARSLGFYVSNNKSIRKIKAVNFEGEYNRIHIYGDINRIPTKIKRKQAKITTRKTNWLVTGIKVIKEKIDNYYGFELDGDNLFLLEDLTVTHNSGKSTLLKNFGCEGKPIWDDSKSIISHFDSPNDGISKLGSVGFNTIPSWYKPYSVLSNGEKFRADLARKLKSNSVIDEYTSVVDRTVAKAASNALSRYVKNNNIENIVLSTCHHDIVEWLEPDWVINLDTGELLDGFFSDAQLSISKYIEQDMIVGPCLKTITI